MILLALTDYDLGHTLEESAARLRKKAHRHVSPSTIASWLEDYKQHCSYRRLRRQGLSRFPANQTIRSIKLYHRQIYAYAYHRPKLELIRNGMLDDKRKGDTRFAAVADFLERIQTECPHDLFRRDDDPKARASQAAPAWADVSRIIVNRKENAATAAAALIIPAVGNNKLRHETLQHFMLANHSVTVAVEIPIWLSEEDIAALEREHQVELVPRIGATDRAITGHIDFLQVRNGAVHVLDYKPDARTNRPIAQLAIYPPCCEPQQAQEFVDCGLGAEVEFRITRLGQGTAMVQALAVLHALGDRGCRNQIAGLFEVPTRSLFFGLCQSPAERDDQAILWNARSDQFMKEEDSRPQIVDAAS
jgi:hypothetical protein